MTHTLPKVVLPVAAVGLLVFAIGFVVRSRDRPTPSQPLVAPNTAEYEHAVAAAGRWIA